MKAEIPGLTMGERVETLSYQLFNPGMDRR
jgi:hypothetical protein